MRKPRVYFRRKHTILNPNAWTVVPVWLVRFPNGEVVETGTTLAGAIDFINKRNKELRTYA